MPGVVFCPCVETIDCHFIQSLESPWIQFCPCLSKGTFGNLPNLEVTFGNRLDKTVKFPLYGTFE